MSAPRFYLLNTNVRGGPRDDGDMLANARAAAFYAPWKHQIDRLRRGDVVFLYRSGAGIVAFGRASGVVEVRDHRGDPAAAGEEHAMALDGFVTLDAPVPAAEVQRIAARSLTFRQTMVALPQGAGERILEALSVRAL
jgi:hypothetical protein